MTTRSIDPRDTARGFKESYQSGDVETLVAQACRDSLTQDGRYVPLHSEPTEERRRMFAFARKMIAALRRHGLGITKRAS